MYDPQPETVRPVQGASIEIPFTEIQKRSDNIYRGLLDVESGMLTVYPDEEA